jgi:hypothetical protein
MVLTELHLRPLIHCERNYEPSISPVAFIRTNYLIQSRVDELYCYPLSMRSIPPEDFDQEKGENVFFEKKERGEKERPGQANVTSSINIQQLFMEPEI